MASRVVKTILLKLCGSACSVDYLYFVLQFIHAISALSFLLCYTENCKTACLIHRARGTTGAGS